MTKFVKVSRNPHPSAKLPSDLDTVVWRYMNFWKFESLLEKNALYLCRADHLQDRFEGTYSRRQILEINDWLNSRGYKSIAEDERMRREIKRRQFYINCWCISKYDLDLMWKAYTTNRCGIAIKSTIKRLQDICDKATDMCPLDISLVDYFGHAEGDRIEYADGFDAFIHKDYHFELDREIRIIHWANYHEPTPEYVLLPVSPSSLIESVVLYPGASHEYMSKIRGTLDSSALKEIPLETSRDDRSVEE